MSFFIDFQIESALSVYRYQAIGIKSIQHKSFQLWIKWYLVVPKYSVGTTQLCLSLLPVSTIYLQSTCPRQVDTQKSTYDKINKIDIDYYLRIVFGILKKIVYLKKVVKVTNKLYSNVLFLSDISVRNSCLQAS